MKATPFVLAVVLLVPATELRVVVPKDDTVLTNPGSRNDFVSLAARADSVVRVKESFRSTHGSTPIVTLDVVEQIAGVPVRHLEIAASVWDVVATWKMRQEDATFLLMIRDRDEILHVQSNGIPFTLAPGIIPIVDEAVPEFYADLYDSLLIIRPVTLDLIRQQLARVGKKG